MSGDVARATPRRPLRRRRRGSARRFRRPRRLRLDDRLDEIRRRLHALARGMPAGEQHVQQHAQRKDVGGGRDRLAGHLLGRRVGRRQRRGAVDRERGGRAAVVIFEQLGDAEIEQLDLALARDQHVRRLEVAVHDQRCVRVRHGIEHVEEEPQPRVHVEPVLIAVPIDRLAVDVLEHEIRLAGRRHARIEQLRDVRMREPRQDAAFALESILAASREREVQELDRHPPIESAIGALREPDRAHPAASDRRHERVGADGRARQRVEHRGTAGSGTARRIVEETRVAQAVASRRSALRGPRPAPDPARGARPARRRARCSLGEIERLIEMRAQGAPAIRIDAWHGSDWFGTQVFVEIQAGLFPPAVDGPFGRRGHRRRFREPRSRRRTSCRRLRRASGSTLASSSSASLRSDSHW